MHLIQKGFKSPVYGIVKMKGTGLNATLERGWCFGTSEFKEKMIDKLDSMPMEGKYKGKWAMIKNFKSNGGK